MSWNGFPRYLSHKILQNLKNKTNNMPTASTGEVEPVKELFFKLPYCGQIGERLPFKYVKRISKELNDKVKVRTIFTNKMIMDFCSVKETIPKCQSHNSIYQIQCPGCMKYYIGKTTCSASKRM